MILLIFKINKNQIRMKFFKLIYTFIKNFLNFQHHKFELLKHYLFLCAFKIKLIRNIKDYMKSHTKKIIYYL